MNVFLIALQTELMKLRRTLALLMVLVAPLIVVSLAFIIVARRSVPFETSESAVLLIASPAFSVWNLLMLPLFIALETTLTASIEHGGKTWKHLFALPIPRTALIGAKFAANLLLVLLSVIALLALVFLAGWALLIIRPDLGLGSSLHLDRILACGGASFAAAFLIIAFHTWLSLRWSSIVVGLGSGIAAVVVGFIIINSDYWNIFPWSYPIIVSSKFMGQGMAGLPALDVAAAESVFPLAVSGIGGLLLILWLLFDLSRRDVAV
jgi:hypothetical protein